MKKRFAYRLFILLTVINCVACLVVVYPGFTHHTALWPISMIGLVYPLFLILLLCSLVIWALQRSKWFFLPLVTILLSWKQIRVLIPLRIKADFNEIKAPGSIRILSWNVSRWDERNKEKRGGVSYRPLMMDYIEMSGADIVCMQEFFECTEPAWFEANIPELKRRGYRYFYFAPSSILQEGKLQYGLCVFSKYEIVHADTIPVPKGLHSEGLIYTDIKTELGLLRVFNANFESAGMNKDDYTSGGKVNLSRNLISKIKNSYQLRNLQALQCSAAMKKSPYPSVLCIDMDDVPNSTAYFTSRGKHRDAFLEKGKGLGRTFRYISPTLRIDYMFIDPVLYVKQFKTESLTFSDHYPILTDIRFTEK